MTRAMLGENSLHKHLWVEAINMACYVQNRTMIRSFIKKNPYKL